MMNRVRLGSPTDEDIRSLMGRFISILDGKGILIVEGSRDELRYGLEQLESDRPPAATTIEDAVNYYRNIRKQDSMVTCFFGTNNEVDKFNKRVLAMAMVRISHHW